MDETHRQDLAAALRRARVVFRGAGVPNDVAGPIFDALDRELASAVPDARPRLSVERTVELSEALTSLGEHGAPPSLVEQAEAAVRQLAPWLERERPSTRWPTGSEPRRFFDPEPVATCSAGRVSFRYARHREAPELDEVHVVDLSERLLRFLGDPRGARLWDDQLAVLRGGTAGAEVAPPSYALSCLEGEHAVVPGEGPITPATLLRLRRDARAGAVDASWIGARETSFVLGRLARLLGPPPEQEQPGLTLRCAIDGAVFWLHGEDRMEGMPVLFASPATPEAQAGAEAVAELLFADAELADVEQLGFVDPPGLVYRVGARVGRPIFELVREDQPPWITVVR